MPPGVPPLSLIPLTPAPPGVDSELGGGATKGEAELGATIALAVVATVFVSLRVYANAVYNSRSKFGWDDGAALAGLALSLAYSGIELSVSKFSRHSWNIPLSWFDDASYEISRYSQSLIYTTALFFTKASLLLLYLVLFAPNVVLRRFIFGTLVVAACLYASNIPLSTFYCAALPGQAWDIDVALRCNGGTVFLITCGVFNVALDLLILILPIPLVLGLKLHRRQKLGVLLIFFIGSLGVFASIAGLVFRILVWQNTLKDIAWYACDIGLINAVELYATLICSSMPSLAAMSKAAFGKVASIFSPSHKRVSRRSSAGLKHERKIRETPMPFVPAKLSGSPTDSDSERESSFRSGGKGFSELEQREAPDLEVIANADVGSPDCNGNGSSSTERGSTGGRPTNIGLAV